MDRNVGDLDRAFRISLALVLLAMGLIYNQTLLFIPAFVLLITGFLGVCPLYGLLGWSTKTYFDYPSVSITQTPVAVEVEERISFQEPEEENKEDLLEARRKRREELFEKEEESQPEPAVEEKKPPTTKRRKRRNARRKNKTKTED